MDQPSMDEIMDHIDSVEDYYSRATLESLTDVANCLVELEDTGLFDPSKSTDVYDETGQRQIVQCPERMMLPDDDTLEDKWKATYEKRRDKWKRKLSNTRVETPVVDSVNEVQLSVMTDVEASEVHAAADGQVMRIPPSVNELPEATVSIEEIACTWTLNTEQVRAFEIIARHSTEKKVKPLHMYLGGSGGTGKSRVIQALTDFFGHKNQSRRLRLAAFTGMAAKNIGGTTLHTALHMSPNKKKSDLNHNHKELVAMWNGVDYLFIDEVSTIGCRLLVDIHDALVSATGRTDVFGGISIIFAGDFAQLPPVLDTKLYTYLDQKKLHADTPLGQKIMFGKLLWRSVDTVVILTEQMRQSGERNNEFVSLLSRLREGTCTTDDFSLLNSRIISTAGEDLSTNDWQNAPIIVSENAVKDAINVKASLAFAQRTNQTVEWFDARDTYRKAKITDPQIRDYLLAQPSGKTGQRLGRMPIVLGMPVLVNQNLDIDGGLVNGSFGYLRDYRFQTDENGVRTLTSCIVEIPDFTGSPLSHLPPRHVAVISDTVEMRSIIHPISRRSCTMKRFQVPLSPGFAMTAHKAQGLTLPRVIIDLAGCRGTEQPYVMASRCQSLDGLLVMRPFSISKITCRRSQEARKEFTRLDIARWQSVAAHGTSEEQNLAEAHLRTEGNNQFGAIERLFLDKGFQNPNQVGELVGQLQEEDESKRKLYYAC